MNTYFHPGNYQVTLNNQDNQPFQMAQINNDYDGTMLMENSNEKQAVTVDNNGQPVFAGTIYFLLFMLAIGVAAVYLFVARARKKGIVAESPYVKDNSAFEV